MNNKFLKYIKKYFYIILMLRHISKLFLFLSFIPIIYSYNNTTCTDIVDIIQEEIKFSNSSIDIIEKAINATCHLIPIKSEKEECMTILDDMFILSRKYNMHLTFTPLEI
jgi:hypothetical protein